MLDLVKVIFLAAVQGLTEFLPISSSGHLGLASHFVNFNPPGLIFEVTTHAGTMLAVLIYYRKRLARILQELNQRASAGRREVLYLIVATVPVGLLGILCGDALESLFDSPTFIFAMLITTGMILLSLVFVRPGSARPLSLRSAIYIGLAQAMAILPGVSRAGTTITVARHLGLSPRTAAEFSLLLMLPAIGGATLMSIGDVIRDGTGELSPTELALAFSVSAAVGYAAIILMVRALTKGVFKWFGVYCLIIGFVGMLLI